ncbi:formate hydrogenlyase subunit 3/multisubunit Na+/H+ antiporter MnhD subunit [Bradyrhizobium diazoefficiens]
MSAVVLQMLCVAGMLGSAVLAIVLSRSTIATTIIYGATLAASAIALIGSIHWLLGDTANAADLILPIGLPWLGAHFRLDGLASFFLVVVNLGGASASLYGLGYGHHEEAPQRVLPFFPAFLAGMNLVVLAGDAFSYLLCWEFMSLASWALVMAHHREPGNAKAGYVYLVMASFGTLALLLAFGLLAGPAGDYEFAAIRTAQRTPYVATLVLILMLLGAGSKAGLVPLHVWLPLAHPAAPSHVSALMSGVMTKVAIYGFIRVVFDLLGQPSWWASVIVLSLGGLTAVMGILYAMMEKDLKRLLAYSTIENVGVIFASLGLALAFQANGLKLQAALAFAAALFHVLNHSFFKSLLFFGAGAVLTATGERDMDKLGGLIHRMPYTSFAVLVGCVSISALPPFNGFVSEWLMFQAVLQSPELPQWALKITVPAVGALLALAAALAAACFVKAYGVTFSRASARRGGGNRRGSRPLLAFGNVHPRRTLLAGRNSAGTGDRRAFADHATDPRRPHADPGQRTLAFDRADCGESQFIQRAACYGVHRDIRFSGRRLYSSLCLSCLKAGAGLGLWLFRSDTRGPIFERKLRSAYPPRLRYARVPRPRSCRDAAPRGYQASAPANRIARSDLGANV